ncbi:hypothetical protein [Halobellus sp. GM3]|uniref:hypothetical protein n=1 Tax=Halobellus sp. GM3 TaxID=3458410 RepID=UPI00403DF6E6
MSPIDGPSEAANGDGESPPRALLYGGALLTGIVAGLHLLHPEYGLLGLFEILNTAPEALVFDPRPLAFVLSGTVLSVGLSLSRNAPNRRPYYVAGVAVAAVYLLGYFAWHFTGHGGFLPGREPLFHGLSPVENVLTHLATDRWAAASKAAEIVLIGVLGALYRKR